MPAGFRCGQRNKPTQSLDWYQGTADAVRKQLFEIQSAHARYVLVLAGDHLYRMDYSEMARIPLGNRCRYHRGSPTGLRG